MDRDGLSTSQNEVYDVFAGKLKELSKTLKVAKAAKQKRSKTRKKAKKAASHKKKKMQAHKKGKKSDCGNICNSTDAQMLNFDAAKRAKYSRCCQ